MTLARRGALDHDGGDVALARRRKPCGFLRSGYPTLESSLRWKLREPRAVSAAAGAALATNGRGWSGSMAAERAITEASQHAGRR